MTAVRHAGVVARALLATVVLIVLTAGVPAILVRTVGNPMPDHWSWSEPLSNSTVLGLLACVAWIFWAQLVLCVIVEVLAEVRLATGRSADWLARVPGTFGGQQALARTLVQAVVAIGMTTTVTTSLTPWVPRAESAAATQPAHEPRVAADVPPKPSAQAAPATHGSQTIEVRVARGDAVWSIAERYLGAGERWREIADLNRGRAMADGATFDDARTILPGWTLLVPADGLRIVQSTNADPDDVTVERGDTLWEIAEERYGDGAAWPRIYGANDEVIVDPDRIYPGQRLVIPGHRSAEPHDHAGKPSVSHPSPRKRSSPVASPPLTHISPSVVPTPPASQPAAEPRGEVAPSDESSFHVEGATITRALVGGGGFLAAGMLALYVSRRRTQSRNRRSGRAALPVAAHLRAEDKALRAIGLSASERAAFFDATLRHLAATAESEGVELPEVVAVRMDDQRLDLHLRTPSPTAPAPWSTSPDAMVWSISTEHQPIATERMSPYPAMVTIGVDANKATWFIDLEGAGVTQIVGDVTAGEELLRFVAAELALNAWSDVETVEIAGPPQDVVSLNYGRLLDADHIDLDELTKFVRQMVENVETSGRSVLDLRRTNSKDAWAPALFLTSISDQDMNRVQPLVTALLDEMARTAGRTSITLVTVAGAPLDLRATTLTFTREGTLETPWAVIRPNGMTADEAAVLGQLLDDADTDGDAPIPRAVGSDGDPTDTDQAGALTAEITEPRRGSGDPDSILPHPDQAYVASAATTPEDLAVLAPAVPPTQAAATLAADPDLDQDLADWADAESQRPKLRVLGPVELHAPGDTTKEVEARPAYFTELAAYLACHPEGVTPNQVAADFGIQNNTLHTRLGQLRKWLGKRPGTDDWHLPTAQRVRGRQVYQLSGVLTDADLFRRLRARGEARGHEGVEDFRKALELVAGRPYDQQRSHGYGWLADTPVDHYVTAAIVDVAHVYATHCLTDGNARAALWSAEKAIMAAPSEEKPRLDLARAMQAMGDCEDAQRYLHREVFNRSDDDRAPLDPTARTQEVGRRIGRQGCGEPPT